METGKRKAIFLDRDGVLNRAIVRNGRPYPPRNLDELQILEGVPEALRTLQKAGFLLICVTNQPDVARGKQCREVVESIHGFLRRNLPLDEILVCYHDDQDECACRKPKTGLLIQAAGRHGIDLSASFMVGDRWKDIEVGQRAGCRTVLIDYQYDEREPSRPPDYRVRLISEAVSCILNHPYRGGVG